MPEYTTWAISYPKLLKLYDSIASRYDENHVSYLDRQHAILSEEQKTNLEGWANLDKEKLKELGAIMGLKKCQN